MSRDGGIHIPGKVGIDGRRRVSRQHGDTLGDLPPDRLGGTDYRDRLGVSLDDDLSASLHALQHGPDILGQIRLADVQHARPHTSDHISSVASTLRVMHPTTSSIGGYAG